MKLTLYFFALLGVLFFGILIHEGVHILQSKEVYSICYDVNQESFAHVDGVYEEGSSFKIEFWAYLINILITMTLFYCIVIDFKKGVENG